MIPKLGMSKKLGPRTFGKREELVFLGKEISDQRDYGDNVAEAIDEEVQSLIQGAYDIATHLLNSNMDKLSRLAAHLVEHETIEGDELKDILDGTVVAA